MAFLVYLKEEIVKKLPQIKKKIVPFHQDYAPCYKLVATNWILQGKRFGSNNEVTANVEAKGKSFFKKATKC